MSIEHQDTNDTPCPPVLAEAVQHMRQWLDGHGLGLIGIDAIGVDDGKDGPGALVIFSMGNLLSQAFVPQHVLGDASTNARAMASELHRGLLSGITVRTVHAIQTRAIADAQAHKPKIITVAQATAESAGQTLNGRLRLHP